MRKVCVLVPLFVLLAQCNPMKKTGDTASDGGSATADPTSTSGGGAINAATTLVGKAMSFLSGGPFEGEITMNISEGGKPAQTIIYMVKGTKMRFDAPTARSMGGGYVIIDSTAKRMTTVTDAKKTAMVMNLDQTAGATPTMPTVKPVIDKTSKTDTVAGYSCDVWTATDASGDKTDLCVAKGIAFPSMGRAAGWMAELGEVFPLRAVTSDPSGKEKTRMEVTKIDKKSVDDAKFEVPAGYNTMNMDQMMKGMGGMGGSLGRPPR